MKTNFILLFLVSIFSIQINAQLSMPSLSANLPSVIDTTRVDYSEYDWDSSFNLKKYNPLVQKNETAVLLERSVLILRGDITERYIHSIIWVGEESSIEKINKVRLSDSKANDLKFLKARTISTDGKVTTLDQESFKKITSDEGTRESKLYAIPGIKVGSFVEILYRYNHPTWKHDFRFVGRNRFNTVKSEVIVQKSKSLTTSILNRNGYELELDTLYNYFIVKKFSMDNIQASIGESYSHDYKGIPRVDVLRNYESWFGIATAIRRVLFPSTNYGTGFGSLLNDSGAKKNKSDVEKIIALEKYLKSSISLTKKREDKYYMPKSILKSKVATDLGLIRLYANAFASAHLYFELYVTTDDDYIELEQDFPSYVGLDQFFFYFPDYELYVLPMNNYYFAGSIPNFISGQNALLLERRDTDSYGKLVKFPYTTSESNYVSTKAVVQVDEEAGEVSVQYSKSFRGDDGIRWRGGYYYDDESEKKVRINEELMCDMENVTIESYNLKNESIDKNALNKDTLVVEGELKTDEILIQIPNGYLLELPKLLGIQTSLFEEHERVTDVYIRRSVSYYHKLVFHIPEGYTVKNIENFEFEEESKTDKQNIGAFKSNASIDNGILTVTVREYYNAGLYTKDHYASFKKVINAAYKLYIAKVKLEQVN